VGTPAVRIGFLIFGREGILKPAPPSIHIQYVLGQQAGGWHVGQKEFVDPGSLALAD
jgi:hypothetical protein